VRKQALTLLTVAGVLSALSLPSFLNPLPLLYALRSQLANVTEPYLLVVIHKVNEEKGWGLPPKCEKALAEYLSKLLLSPKGVTLLAEVINMKAHCNCTLTEALVYAVMEKLPTSVYAKCFG
jgi:hypothetical protein